MSADKRRFVKSRGTPMQCGRCGHRGDDVRGYTGDPSRIMWLCGECTAAAWPGVGSEHLWVWP